MNSNHISQLQAALKVLDTELTRDSLNQLGETMLDTEHRIVDAIAERRPGLASVLERIWTLSSTTCAWTVLERALSQSTLEQGDDDIPLTIAFCPVTLTLVPHALPLPDLNLQTFNVLPTDLFIRCMAALGLLDDCQAVVQRQIEPLSPWLSVPLIELAHRGRQRVIDSRDPRSGRIPSNRTESEGSDALNLHVAGNVIIGSFLIPIVFLGDGEGDLPAVVRDEIPKAALASFRDQASRLVADAVTPGMGMNLAARVGEPMLLPTALPYGLRMHMAFSTAYAANKAVGLGCHRGKIILSNRLDVPPEILSVAFEVDHPEVESEFTMGVRSQEEIDVLIASIRHAAMEQGLTDISFETRTDPGLIPSAN